MYACIDSFQCQSISQACGSLGINDAASSVCISSTPSYIGLAVDGESLSPQADKLFLYEHFAPLGAILSVNVLTDDSGACRGVGFVNFADKRDAAAAAAALNGTRLSEKPLHISIQPVRMRAGRVSAPVQAQQQVTHPPHSMYLTGTRHLQGCMTGTPVSTHTFVLGGFAALTGIQTALV